ncbi:G protein complex alpha subunit GanA [Penicillium angulare]|uniref:G protein complex alpha subunit GanA n=1 Tax=Penicillium angulare TaxID=116970 RepID=UPI0025400622|nr:G protein complex alpha subunit GanA [Penicillium angulare]KAJ5288181.1 G protein complex alpha subunit GanA [Penicillium angulare]
MKFRLPPFGFRERLAKKSAKQRSDQVDEQLLEYGRQERRQSLSLLTGKGTFHDILILGRRGSGKSTVIKLFRLEDGGFSDDEKEAQKALIPSHIITFTKVILDNFLEEDIILSEILHS